MFLSSCTETHYSRPLRASFLCVLVGSLICLCGGVHASTLEAVVTNIRIGAGANKTRVVFDSSEPLSYTTRRDKQGKHFVLELDHVTFTQEALDPDIADSSIADFDIEAATRASKAKVSIMLENPAVFSDYLLEPSGHYGYRLVVDIKQSTSVASRGSKGIAPSAVPIADPVSQTGVQHASVNLTGDGLSRSGAAEEALKRAKRLMAQGEYLAAIGLYKQLMQAQDIRVRQLAHEYHAVALERSGRREEAKAQYTRYLARYPESDATRRVQQRQAALLTLELPVKTLRTSRRKTKTTSTNRIDSYGSFYQYYRWAQNVDDSGESKESLSSLYSSLSYNTRYRSQAYEAGLRLDGGYSRDFLSEGRGGQGRLSYLYAYGENRSNNSAIKLGRQRNNKGGVMGRFDGLTLSSPTYKSSQLHFVVGSPVDRSSDTFVDKERQFYGISVDLGPFYHDLDINVFYIEQTLGDLTDRRALGAELRYISQALYVSGMLDYDLHFQELNMFLLNGNYRFDSGTNASLSINYRKSPFLTTRNALIGQQLDEFEDLGARFDDDEEVLTELALDRTLDSKTVSAFLNHPLSERFAINATVAISSLSDSPESAGVPAFEGTDNEVYSTVQLLAHGLIAENDTLQIGFNHATLTNADLSSIQLQYRYLAAPGLRIFPRLRYQLRDSDNGSAQSQVIPLCRVEYRFLKKHTVDVEIGAYLLKTEDQFDDLSEYKIHFFNLGYFYLF